MIRFYKGKTHATYNGVCYKRYEETSWGAKGRPNVNVCTADKKIERATMLKSVFDYRFNSNTETHMFLFAKKRFLGFYCTDMGVVGAQSGFIWNRRMGGLHGTVEHRHLGR